MPICCANALTAVSANERSGQRRRGLRCWSAKRSQTLFERAMPWQQARLSVLQEIWVAVHNELDALIQDLVGQSTRENSQVQALCR